MEYTESLPLWFWLPMAIILWGVLLFMLLRSRVAMRKLRNTEARMNELGYIYNNGQWVNPNYIGENK